MVEKPEAVLSEQYNAYQSCDLRIYFSNVVLDILCEATHRR